MTQVAGPSEVSTPDNSATSSYSRLLADCAEAAAVLRRALAESDPPSTALDRQRHAYLEGAITALEAVASGDFDPTLSSEDDEY
jgi:ABC-type transporter Mla subunit MlaD